MDFLYRPFYNTIVYPAILGGAKIGSLFHRKLAAGFQIHKGSTERWLQKAATLPSDTIRIWFHATSTGEFETARPVMEYVKKAMGNRVSIIFSYYSPTVQKTALHYNVPDICEVLPLDTTAKTRTVLKAVSPNAIVFVRYDAWPNMVWQASPMGVRLILIDALLREKSFRNFPLFGRSFSRSLYSKFSLIGSVSEDDARRLRAVTENPQTVQTVGDSRFDRILDRQKQSSSVPIPESLQKISVPLFICGSTWPNDEDKIIPAIARLFKKGFEFHTVIVPHEPSARHVESIMKALWHHPLPFAKYSDIQKGQADPNKITILDAVGFLAEFYRIGTFCYVGGGFLISGVHNTVEPAIMGMPLMFGPRYHNAPEAEQMVKIGAAHEIRNADQVYRTLSLWLKHPYKVKEEGQRARQLILDHLGASQSYAKKIMELVGASI